MQDHLSLTFAALADPTRRAMLAQLSRGEATVSTLAQPFLNEMSLPAITKHLKVLEKAGFITKTREAQSRRCQLNVEAFKEVADWVEQYRRFWEESFDRLDAYLKTVTAAAHTRDTNPHTEHSHERHHRTPSRTRKGRSAYTQRTQGKKHGRKK